MTGFLVDEIVSMLVFGLSFFFVLNPAFPYILCWHNYAILELEQCNLQRGCIYTPDQTDTGNAPTLPQTRSNHETGQVTAIICTTTSSAYNDNYSLTGNMVTPNTRRRRRAAEGRNVSLLFSRFLWSHDISMQNTFSNHMCWSRTKQEMDAEESHCHHPWRDL